MGRVTKYRTARSRSLRHESSRAEQIFWELVRAKRMVGVKFRRQHPIGPYFADFACVSKKLVVEIDGQESRRHLGGDRAIGWGAMTHLSLPAPRVPSLSPRV